MTEPQQYPDQPQFPEPQFPEPQFPQPQFAQPQYAGYPAQSYAASQYPAAHGAAGSGVRIAAGVLAILGGLLNIYYAILNFTQLAHAPEYRVLFSFEAGVEILTAVLLLAGGILVFPRRTLGGWVIVSGAGLYVLASIVFSLVFQLL